MQTSASYVAESSSPRSKEVMMFLTGETRMIEQAEAGAFAARGVAVETAVTSAGRVITARGNVRRDEQVQSTKNTPSFPENILGIGTCAIPHQVQQASPLEKKGQQLNVERSASRRFPLSLRIISCCEKILSNTGVKQNGMERSVNINLQFQSLVAKSKEEELCVIIPLHVHAHPLRQERLGCVEVRLHPIGERKCREGAQYTRQIRRHGLKEKG